MSSSPRATSPKPLPPAPSDSSDELADVLADASLGNTKIEQSITTVQPSELASANNLGTGGSRVGRPPRAGMVPVTWSVRGVERETRDAVELAARQQGKTLGQYFNDEVRQFALGQATPDEPSATEQIRGLKEQVERLRQLVENLAALLGSSPNDGR